MVAVSPSLWNPNWAAPPAALLVCTWSPSLGSGCPGSSLGKLGEAKEEQEIHCSCGSAGRCFLTAAPCSHPALQPGQWGRVRVEGAYASSQKQNSTSRHLERICMGRQLIFISFLLRVCRFGVASRDEHVLLLKLDGFWAEDSRGPTAEHGSPSRRKQGTYPVPPPPQTVQLKSNDHFSTASGMGFLF